MKKLILLGLMTSLLAFGNSNEVKAKAEEVTPAPGSSATFFRGGSKLRDRIREFIDGKEVNYSNNVVSIKITNKSSDLPTTTICDPIGITGCFSNEDYAHYDDNVISAYLSEATGSTAENKRYDCVLYANVETIYLHSNSELVFCEFPELETIDLSILKTKNLMNICLLFNMCYKLKSLDISHFDTSNLTQAIGAFADCRSLTELNLGNFQTGNMTRMEGLFLNCQSLTEIDTSNFDTSKATSMAAMFAGCSSLKSLDLSKFDCSHVDNFSTDVGQYLDYFLEECDSLEYIKTPALMPEGHNIALPAQFSPYCDITEISAANLADHPVINLPADKFIYEWKALRTSGGEEGICGALNQGTADNTTLKTLLGDYEKFDNESKTYINGAKDTEGVTIGESVEYINNVLNKTQTTEKDYGIGNEESGSIANLDVIENYSYIIVAVALLGALAVIAYYFIEKKRLASR